MITSPLTVPPEDENLVLAAPNAELAYSPALVALLSAVAAFVVAVFA